MGLEPTYILSSVDTPVPDLSNHYKYLKYTNRHTVPKDTEVTTLRIIVTEH